MENVENHKKLKLTSSSSDVSSLDDLISKLPSDLKRELFCRLPAKSLCRLKCVSKSMQSMIQDPVFVNERWSKCPPFCLELYTEDSYGEAVVFIQKFNQDGSGAKTRQRLTFGGTLWCLRRCNGLIAFYNDNDKLLLCNLTNRVMIRLPTIHGPSGMERFEFGFDSSSNKYKVLTWMEDKNAEFCISDVHIRTLEKDSSWRPVEVTQQFRSLGGKPRINVNGALFWFDASEARFISFDLADEKFGIIKVPGEINLEDFTYSMFEIEGRLGFVELPIPDEQKRCHFEIINLWILKNTVSHQWMSMLKNTTIPLEGTNLRSYYMEEEFTPVADISALNGDIVIAAADDDHQYIFLYSFLNGQFKLIRITGLGMRHIYVKNHVKNDVNLEEFGERVFLYNC
ncbi:hypothetical protein AQUCO_01700106v1 [Aquilegia coerulea]|uniref:F-box domain-containing protein n=1 Tax=Aquilegia coerulea TaxID=218851 RepID=A0A2G5DL83_AQUCA|nr:hypothetical protein AQUCO_01700106v1 [Aquilegia coerulea]